MADTPTGDALLATAAGGWGYAESTWVDGWQLRAADSFTNRANSAWPLGPLQRPLPEAVDAVSAWYIERRLRPLIQVIAGSELDLALDGLGHKNIHARAHRQVAHVPDVRDRLLGVAPIGVKQSFADAPTEDWLSLYRAGGPPPVAARVLDAGAAVRYATIHDLDGTPLAIGRAALSVPPDSQQAPTWVGLSGIETMESARRRGLAKLVIDALLEWADEQGASDAYLEVTPSNTPAIALYAAVGFTTHHDYHYRVIG